ENLFGETLTATPGSTRAAGSMTSFSRPSLRSQRSPETTWSLRSQRCDCVDLVQPGNYSVTAFPAQNGFCTRPVVPLQGLV
ncbi:MAG: hypothetical protein ABEL51_06820, partial [Salinibacter sp.]